MDFKPQIIYYQPKDFIGKKKSNTEDNENILKLASKSKFVSLPQTSGTTSF